MVTRAAPFETSTQIDANGEVVIRVEGEVDASTTRSLRAALEHGLQQSASIVVDLGGLRFMDSSGLTALLWGHHAAERAGGSLRIRRPPARVVRVLEITGLDSLLLIDGDAPPTGATQT